MVAPMRFAGLPDSSAEILADHPAIERLKELQQRQEAARQRARELGPKVMSAEAADRKKAADAVAAGKKMPSETALRLRHEQREARAERKACEEAAERLRVELLDELRPHASEAAARADDLVREAKETILECCAEIEQAASRFGAARQEGNWYRMLARELSAAKVTTMAAPRALDLGAGISDIRYAVEHEERRHAEHVATGRPCASTTSASSASARPPGRHPPPDPGIRGSYGSDPPRGGA
jgi:hypothetical protein